MLVYCAGCSKVAGYAVKHLPPACEYNPGTGGPVQEPLPMEIKVSLGCYERLRRCEADINKLADFILAECPGEPSQNAGAVDTAIYIIRRLSAVASQKGANWDSLAEYKRLVDKLALFFRTHYQQEIASGLHDGKDPASVAIGYMLVERDLTKRGWWGRLKYFLWGV